MQRQLDTEGTLIKWVFTRFFPNSYYTIVIYGGRSLGQIPHLNSFRQLEEGQRFLLYLLFPKNHQPKIILMPQRHILGWQNPDIKNHTLTHTQCCNFSVRAIPFHFHRLYTNGYKNNHK